MTELTSAPIPAPGADDHRRSVAAADAVTDVPAPVIIAYADFECPYCAAVDARLRRLAIELVFRHFPVRSSHPRAWAAACAAEAAGRQGRFWEMHDALFADQGRLEDPHLWERARRLNLDVERFDADRRSDATRERVNQDFRAGIRAGVVTTPTLFRWAGGGAVSVAIGDLETPRAP